MKTNIRKRGDSALAELVKTYELVREELADRIDDIDAKALGSRALGAATDLRQAVEGRVRPRPKRTFPVVPVAVGVGLAAGIAFLLYDRRRRDMIQGRITQLGTRASTYGRQGVSGAVDGVMGRVRPGQPGAEETRLRTEVETAIVAAGEGMPDGLQLAVEGRTVYLRGAVPAAIADQAASRAQSVDGVAAVVNLTSEPAAAANGRTATRTRA